MSNLRVISGETKEDIAANEIRGEFGQVCDDALKEDDRMAGYVVITFNNKGDTSSWAKFGESLPIPTVLIPDVVKNIVAIQHVFNTRGQTQAED